MREHSILITGCSSGIGYCSALTLKNRGYRVFAAARKLQDVTKLNELGLESVLLDVDDSQSIEAALAQVLEKTGGKLGALFNNSGFLQAGAIEDLSRDSNRAQFETNVFGPMELIRQVLPIMRKQGEGRIIQNSSILGIITVPYYGAYNASKFALEGFSNTLRQELRGTSIYVSVINPGPIKSALRKNAHEKYQQNLKTKTSAYSSAYDKLEKVYFSSQAEGKKSQGPEIVVKKLIHALESKRPKAHYYVGLPTNLVAVMRCLLPESMLDWILTK